MRLNAYLARAGVASRRSADELIKAGRVTVNGEPGQLNTYDVLVSDDVVFTQAAFESFVSGPQAADTEGSEA